MLPYRRFADILTEAYARLGADVDRYSFIVMDLHHLLLAGLPAHSLFVLGFPHGDSPTTSPETDMQHDVRLRANARVIYDGKHLFEDQPSFEEAEQRRTALYMDAVATAIAMRRLERGYVIETRQIALV